MGGWQGDGTFLRDDGTLTGSAICETQENNETALSGVRMDADLNEIVGGLENCLTRDGQNTPTANIPMGSNKFTGLAAASASGEAVHWGQFELNDFTPTVTVNGGGSAIGGGFLQSAYCTVGDLTFVNFELASFSISGTVSSIVFSSLPFSIGSSSWSQGVYAFAAGSSRQVGVVTYTSASSITFYPPNGAASFTAGGGNQISFNGIIT